MEEGAKQKSTWLICSAGKPASLVCIQKDCKEKPIICQGEKCDCRQHHLEHNQLLVEGLFQKINKDPVLPPSVTSNEKATNTLLDSIKSDIDKCR